MAIDREQTAAFAFAQVTGAAGLRARVPRAFASAAEQAHELSKRLMSRYRGERVDSSARGPLVLFPDVDAAVGFCMALQRLAMGLDWPEPLLHHPAAKEERSESGAILSRGLRFRMAVHHGRVLRETTRSGVTLVGGPAVHQVARIAAVAHGGQVLLSPAAWAAFRGGSTEPTVPRDLGSHRLVGLPGPTQLVQMVPAALAARAFAEVKSMGVLRTNVVARRTPLMGREGDFSSLRQLGALGVRVLTVVGSSGVGTSRLIRHHTASVAEDYADRGGAWFVACTGDRLNDLVRPIGAALGVPLLHGRHIDHSVTQLGRALASLGPTLVVIDGLRTPEPAIKEAFRAWRDVASDLRLLLTADAPLEIPGEVSYRLDTLPLPSTSSRHEDAIRLYVQAAGDGLSEWDPVLVRGVVTELAGNPLAIELAGGLAPRCGPAELTVRLRALGGGPMRVIDVVWERLDAVERFVLSRCAVFPAGFDLLGAEALAEAPEFDVAATLGGLRSLHLVGRHMHPEAAEISYSMIDPRVRRLALARLGPIEERRARIRFADHVLGRAELWAAAHRDSERECAAALAVLSDELLEIIRYGMASSHKDGPALDRAMRALLALHPVFVVRGPLSQALELHEAVMRHADMRLDQDPILQVRVLLAVAELTMEGGWMADAEAPALRAAAIAERWADKEGLLRSRVLLGKIALETGRVSEAELVLTEARARLEERGDEVGVADVDGTLGRIAARRGQAEAGVELLSDAIERLRGHGVPRRTVASMFERLADILIASGRLGEAAEANRKATVLYEGAGLSHRAARASIQCAVVALEDGRLEDATARVAEALGRVRAVGDRWGEGKARMIGGLVALNHGDDTLARSELLAALALAKPLDDPALEGDITGYLGVLHHLLGRRDAARDYYKRACWLMEGSGLQGRCALFTGWAGALAAEEGDQVAAKAMFGVASRLLVRVADEGVGHALAYLRSRDRPSVGGRDVELVRRWIDTGPAVLLD
jgi:tetratricopeptide (TPR) repeat protein